MTSRGSLFTAGVLILFSMLFVLTESGKCVSQVSEMKLDLKSYYFSSLALHKDKRKIDSCIILVSDNFLDSMVSKDMREERQVGSSATEFGTTLIPPLRGLAEAILQRNKGQTAVIYQGRVIDGSWVTPTASTVEVRVELLPIATENGCATRAQCRIYLPPGFLC